MGLHHVTSISTYNCYDQRATTVGLHRPPTQVLTTSPRGPASEAVVTLWRFIHDALDAPLSALDAVMDGWMAGWPWDVGWLRMIFGCGMRDDWFFKEFSGDFLFRCFFLGVIKEMGSPWDAIDRSIFLGWRIWGFSMGCIDWVDSYILASLVVSRFQNASVLGNPPVASILFGWVESPNHRDP